MLNHIIASKCDSNREQVKTYIKRYILISYENLILIYRITNNSEWKKVF